MPATRPTTAAPDRRAVLRSAAALGAAAGLAGCARSSDRSFPDADWPMAGGGPRNTSSVDGAFPEAVTEAWRTDIGGWPITQPVVVDGAVYVGTDRRFQAVDAADGSQLWKIRLRERDADGVASPEVAGSPAYAATDDVAFVVDGDIVALDAATGDERWRWDLRTDVVGAAPVTADGTVVALGNRSAALSHERPGFGLGSRVRWTLPNQTTEMVSPVVGGGHLYVVNPFTDHLVAYCG